MKNNEESKYEKKFCEFEELKQTVSDGEDDDNEEVIEALTNKENSEIDKDSDEENDAFNFQQTRAKKPSGAPSDYLLRESRIGNLLRNSIYEQKVKRVSDASKFQKNIDPLTTPEIIEEAVESIKKIDKPDQIKEKSVKLSGNKDVNAKSEVKHHTKSNLFNLLYLEQTQNLNKNDTMKNDVKRLKGRNQFKFI